jgi:hypothetical protein
MTIKKHHKRSNPEEAIARDGFTPRYLTSKKSIDDHSLNPHVYKKLLQAVHEKKQDHPLQILECGAGIGTMFTRMIDWGLLRGSVLYRITDNDPRLLHGAHKYLSQWATKRNHAFTWLEENHGQLTTEDAEVSVLFEVVDVKNIAQKSYLPSSYDLIIAHALLDLVDFSVVLPALFSFLKDDALAYLTCNFNGQTLFLPECEDDEEIIQLYHDSMEKRLQGASRTGKNLLLYLQQQGLEILAAGSSDWIIHPQQNKYSKDEEFFLHAIIEMIEKELTKIDGMDFSITEWSTLRHQQAENGQLTLLASHLDFLVRASAGRFTGS